MIKGKTFKINTIITLLLFVLLTGCFDSLSKAAENNRAGLVKDRPCPDCPSMGKIHITQPFDGNVEITELCKKTLKIDSNVSLAKSEIVIITKARISKLEYHKCVDAGVCSSHYMLTKKGVKHPDNWPVITTVQGALEYKHFLSERIDAECRFLSEFERSTLRDLPHEVTPPCKQSCIHDDYDEIHGLNHLDAPIGSYPTRTQCGMLDFQAVEDDITLEKFNKNQNPKSLFNVRLICKYGYESG